MSFYKSRKAEAVKKVEDPPAWLIRYYVDGTPPPRGTDDHTVYVRARFLHDHYPGPSLDELLEMHKDALAAALAKRRRTRAKG